MFGFDKAYSLKCLTSDKQGPFYQNRLWPTWEWWLISLHTLLSVITSKPRWPTTLVPSSVSLTHRENKTRLCTKLRNLPVAASALQKRSSALKI